ncbi:MAG: CopD family protein [Oleiphilaceae bacterium]|nr:CopD family protein [Oleiphilaceae bacterium]
MSLALSLHLLAAIVWIGGMFFAYMCLRPAAAQLLEPAVRLRLWQSVFSRFFRWVGLAIVLLIVSGHFMTAKLGGMAGVGKHVHIMLALGYLMMGLFLHLYFALFRGFKRNVEDQQWQEAGDRLNRMRRIVAINLSLGLVIAVVASGGKFWL